MIYQQPWELVQNKVRGEGGRETDRFRGAPDPRDIENGAEAWIGSVTRANGATAASPNLGCSEVVASDGSRRYLHDIIREAPEEVLGSQHMAHFGTELGILVKLLDVKKKFLLQSHPNRAVAKALWDSDYGKEECWHILSVRQDVKEPPHIFLGFKPGITREMFESTYRTSTMEALEALCHKMVVQPGETYFVPAGMPHALGEGCFTAEVQEPSDITAVPLPQEKLLSFRRIANPDGVFLPIETELYEARMLESFDYTGYPQEALLAKTKSENPVIRSGSWGKEILLIGSSFTQYFSCTLLQVCGEVPLLNTGDIRIGLVTRGAGELRFDGGCLPVRQGSEIFFPYQAKNIVLSGDVSMMMSNPAGAKLL